MKLPCDKEPIHIINRIQPCGYLIVITAQLKIVQCSSNIFELLPSKDNVSTTTSASDSHSLGDDAAGTPAAVVDSMSLSLENQLSHEIIGKDLGYVLHDPDAVSKVQMIVSSYSTGHCSTSATSEAANNFLIRSKGVINSVRRGSGGVGEMACDKTAGITFTVIKSGVHFLLEIETIGRNEPGLRLDHRDVLSNHETMMFMEKITSELHNCCTIEEMATTVCSYIMAETPYDRGMVYRFDHDHSGEVIYEAFRGDAGKVCTQDRFLGLRFPASDIPKPAREAFMKNTLRFIYDVNGTDYPLYPQKIPDEFPSGSGSYTDLSLCRLRGVSQMHITYLKNMKVTSTMSIAIIVNKRLWGLYSFHGYREPLKPSALTRFLCEMASIMTSMIMETIEYSSSQHRLIEIENVTSRLRNNTLSSFLQDYHLKVKEILEVDSISFRVRGIDDNDDTTSQIVTFGPEGKNTQISKEAFDSLMDMYINVCRDYGAVFIDEQKTNPILLDAGTVTFAFWYMECGIDMLLVRDSTVETVEWGGDPTKTLEPDGTLTPRNSFASYVKDHVKIGRSWSDVDKRVTNSFFNLVNQYYQREVAMGQTRAIQSLKEEKERAIKDVNDNFHFFAHMAHELRTPFHAVLGSLSAMKEDPVLAKNELLLTAEMCGKNMMKTLDDILLVAKGSYNLELDSLKFNAQTFLKDTLAEMRPYATMEGASIRLRKEDILHPNLIGDHNKIRQIVNNLISNAIKFSNADINVEILQRNSFREIISVWKTYGIVYPHCEPSLKSVLESVTNNNDNNLQEGTDTIWTMVSVFDKGIGIKPTDLKKLGKAFTQLSTGRRKKYQGTGLGLNICNMLLSAMKGRLVIFSVPEHGSCFTFAMPLTMDRDTMDVETNPSVPAVQQVTVDVTSDMMATLKDEVGTLLQKPTTPHDNHPDRDSTTTLTQVSSALSSSALQILVVDDSAVNRKLCTRKIKKFLPQVSVIECPNMDSTLTEVFHDHGSIMGIFMDYHMPGGDGDECTRRIREFECGNGMGTGRVYIVGFTADILDGSKEALVKAGMDSIIGKPEPKHAFEKELVNMWGSYKQRNNIE